MSPFNHVTYSRNVFVPLTNVCRNRCKYCGFRRDISHPEAHLLSQGEVEGLLGLGAEHGCSEALFTFGERPEEVPGFRDWLGDAGHDNIIDYLVELCKMAIRSGLLPHSNPGIMSLDEVRKLRPVNASLGLMLETLGRVAAHEGCSGKIPEKRLATIEAAGKLRVPFTTGILVGIGETWEDRIASLEAIRDLHLRHGHIQEVIVQNFVPKPYTPMAGYPAPAYGEMLKVVALARGILPEDIAIQVSPNLIDPRDLIRWGASDLGGISPVTIDYINPESRWPDVEELGRKVGVSLRERLPIYPKYVKMGWYSDIIRPLIGRYADPEGFRK